MLNLCMCLSQTTGNYEYGLSYNLHERANVLAFHGTSLQLPDDLSYINDLDTVTGKWK